jgi:hypothetical protein
MAVGIRRTDHATPLYPQKLALTLPASCCRSIGIVPSRIKATELFLLLLLKRVNRTRIPNRTLEFKNKLRKSV